MMVSTYVSVLRKRSKPIEIHRYLTYSSLVTDLTSINVGGSSGEHTVAILAEEPYVEPEWITIVVFYSHTDSVYGCHISTIYQSCQYKELRKVSTHRSFMNTRKSNVSTNISHI